MNPSEAVQGWRRLVLCLAVAGLLWVALLAERAGEDSFIVPLELVGVPRGVAVASAVPATVHLTVSGPYVALFRQRCRSTVCRLDLSGMPAGAVAFPALERTIPLDAELKVIAIAPASLEVKLASAAH